jgi:hypothetical protein
MAHLDHFANWFPRLHLNITDLAGFSWIVLYMSERSELTISTSLVRRAAANALTGALRVATGSMLERAWVAYQ